LTGPHLCYHPKEETHKLTTTTTTREEKQATIFENGRTVDTG